MGPLQNPADYLARNAGKPDGALDLGLCALALAAMDQPGISLGRYINHINRMVRDVKAAHEVLLGQGRADDAPCRVQALRQIIVHAYGYQGDTETYDDLQNASLIRVIERRRGIPVTLAILYLQAARAQGWDAQGINFPGRFLLRVDAGGRRVIFDPFDQARALEAHDLRALLKQSAGPAAELTGACLAPATNREILIRLQNNIKSRQIETEDYQGALETVMRMRRLDPSEYRLLLDAGVLLARTRKIRDAIACLEEYIACAPNARDRGEAAALLRELRQQGL